MNIQSEQFYYEITNIDIIPTSNIKANQSLEEAGYQISEYGWIIHRIIPSILSRVHRISSNQDGMIDTLARMLQK